MPKSRMDRSSVVVTIARRRARRVFARSAIRSAGTSLDRGEIFDRTRVTALFVAPRTDDLGILLAAADHQERILAFRTGLGDRLLPQLEVTLRVVPTTVEGFSAAFARA